MAVAADVAGPDARRHRVVTIGARLGGLFAAPAVRRSPVDVGWMTSVKSIAKPGKVTFNIRNVGHVEHDFRISGEETPLIRPGKSSRLIITFRRKGTYHHLCTVPGHAPQA
jgi:hypothetical protein